MIKKGSVFNAGASYMQIEYLASIHDSSGIFHTEPEQAMELLNWDPETDGWGSEYWADIVSTRSGHLLAVVADGQWGQPSTEYYAVLELSVDKSGWTTFHRTVTNDAGRIYKGSIDFTQIVSGEKVEIAEKAWNLLKDTCDEKILIDEDDARQAWEEAKTEIEEEEDTSTTHD